LERINEEHGLHGTHGFDFRVYPCNPCSKYLI